MCCQVLDIPEGAPKEHGIPLLAHAIKFVIVTELMTVGIRSELILLGCGLPRFYTFAVITSCRWW
jgi:hypothetical protein